MRIEEQAIKLHNALQRYVWQFTSDTERSTRTFGPHITRLEEVAKLMRHEWMRDVTNELLTQEPTP